MDGALGVLLLSSDGVLVHRKVIPSSMSLVPIIFIHLGGER